VHPLSRLWARLRQLRSIPERTRRVITAARAISLGHDFQRVPSGLSLRPTLDVTVDTALVVHVVRRWLGRRREADRQ
jgi:hypothetical protein